MNVNLQSPPTAALPQRKDPSALIFAILLGLLGLSVVLSLAEVPFLTTAAILSIATVKAILVALFFMNLKLEPSYIWLIVAFALLFTLILLALLVPDLVFYFLWGWMGQPGGTSP